ncbi:hypothetical protein [Streptomyces sp. 8K308]|uniref:hypothetical protein n=1 Tax=Streptomyces sp. 8K308 TaxID=2530388 RepID=UPI001FB5F9E3|nr:hypothetical protein [Streptomyces sp. 8K308]
MLALLALAWRAGVAVPGQREAIEDLVALLTEWAVKDGEGHGVRWPGYLTLDSWLRGPGAATPVSRRPRHQPRRAARGARPRPRRLARPRAPLVAAAARRGARGGRPTPPACATAGPDCCTSSACPGSTSSTPGWPGCAKNWPASCSRTTGTTPASATGAP